MKKLSLKRYLWVPVLLMSPMAAWAQHSPDAEHAAHSFWYSVQHHTYSQLESEHASLDRKLFTSQLPAQVQDVLPYIMEAMNKGSQTLKGFSYRITEIPESSKQMEPTFELSFAGKQMKAEVKVKRSLMKNPLYLLDVLIMLDGVFSVGIKASTPHKVVYHYPFEYYHKHHKQWYSDPHKTSYVHSAFHLIHSINSVLGINTNIEDFKNVNAFSETEIRTNARLGSVYAQLQLSREKLRLNDSSLGNYKSFSYIKDLSEAEKKAAILELASAHGIALENSQSSDELAARYFHEKKLKTNAELQGYEKLARARYRDDAKHLNDPEKKAEKSRLESQPLKLNDLLLANDRDGVANLLETYLPIEVMEPVEKRIWLDWIDAIRNPNKENAVVLYRGLDNNNDKLQRTKDVAGNEKIGLFSVLLNKNQGSFTRRLRSLTTMRYKIMAANGYDLSPKSPLESPPLMTRMMDTHAVDPKGSPFMSFTTNPVVARSFAESGIVAVHIDQRRLLPNFSGIASEFEILAPLLVFPDEVLVKADLDPNQDKYMENNEIFNKFALEVQDKIKKGNLKTLPPRDLNTLRKGLEVFKEGTTEGSKALCRQIFG